MSQGKCLSYMPNKFSSDNDNNEYHKFRDHSHYRGKFRGTADNVCNKIRFISSLKFIPNSLSSLSHNHAEGLHSSKCKDCISCLEYKEDLGKLLIFNCSNCSTNDKKEICR